MDESDTALVVRAQADLPYETKSFESLATRYYPVARRIALGIVGNADDADSVAQDVMLRVFHGLKSLRDTATFEGWLRRIIVNVARTFLAKERREREKTNRAAEEWDESIEDDDVQLSGDHDVAATLLSRLSPEERTIFAMKFVEDLEFAEIANIIGAKLSATKMRYYRALKKINDEQSD